MAKTINDIKQELGISNSSSFEDLLTIANQYKVFSSAEINNIKAISVLPLPTNVKDRAQELKQRFTDIVLNENKGQLHSINVRTIIILELLEKLNTLLEDKADKAESYTQDQINVFLLQKADKSTTYTKTEVDDKVNLKADKADIYTKQEVNEFAVGLMDDIDVVRTNVDMVDNRTIVLESNFETLKSIQNVVDIVPTYSALQSYRYEVETDDKIQVIADETHDDASTIYNWNGSAWVYIGAYGSNTYIKNVIDGKLDLKMAKENPTGTGSISMNDGTASGNFSYANGDGATASGMFSKAIGFGAIARGSYAVAYAGSATANYAFAYGMMAEASAPHSRALGEGTKAKGYDQIVTGKFNIADTDSLEIVGNGAYRNPNNARLLDSNGNEYLRGDLFIDSTFTSSDGDLTSKTGTSVKNALSIKADKSDTYTRAVIDSMILTLSTDKADKSNTYTKTEIDNTMQEVGQMFEIVGNEVLKKADKTELNNAINDLRWELGSHTLDVESDTDTKYIKSVPSGAIGCQINKLGGMSYKSENLLVLTDVAETTVNGITYKVENGVLYLNGTATTSFSFSRPISQIAIGTYSSLIKVSGTTTNTDNFYLSRISNGETTFNLGLTDGTTKSGITTSAEVSYIRTWITNGATFTNFIIKPMLVSGSTPPTNWSEGFSGIRNTAVSQLTINSANLLELANDNSYGIVHGNNFVVGQTYTLKLFTKVFRVKVATSSSQPALDCLVSQESNAGITTVTFTYANGSNWNLYLWGYGTSDNPNAGLLSDISTVQPMLVTGSTAPMEYKPYATPIIKTIPSQIQALTGYGWGIDNTCYNYIDFERKVFVQKVGRVDLGSLSWQYYVGETNTFIIYSVKTNQNMKLVSSNNVVPNIITSKYETNTLNILRNVDSDKMVSIAVFDALVIKDKTYDNNVNAFKSAMSGVYLYYELATPVETDISAYLTTDTIDVEPLGTLEFTNTYSQDVPSDIDYLIEEVKA